MENNYLLEDKKYLEEVLTQFDSTRKEIAKLIDVLREGIQNAESFNYNDPAKDAVERLCKQAEMHLCDLCSEFPTVIYSRFCTPRESPPQM